MEPLIELRDLQVRRDDHVIFQELDLVLQPRERLAILGPNGAGKTTLLRTMVGLEQPATGQVILFGQACTSEADFRRQRTRVGFLFQESDDQLFCPSVLEDVSFGPCNLGLSHDQAYERARATLQALGIAHLAERFTHRLSGGEKRLVCLAGLLAMKPDVLLLDEPTNGVDAENGQRLRAALQAFDGAVLLVSHDEDFVVSMATRALVFSEGTLKLAQIHDHRHYHEHPHLHVPAGP